MAIRLEVIDEVEALHGLAEAWQANADDAGVLPLFRGPRWLLAWWRAYQRQLGAELYTLAIFDDAELVGLAPFYRREARRSPSRSVVEIRLVGDAGPRPPALGILAKPGYQERVGNAIGDHLASHAADWDVVDLLPLDDPSATRAHMVNRLATRGRPMDSSSAGAAQRIELRAHSAEFETSEGDARAFAYIRDADQLRKGLAALRRLSRLELSLIHI